MEDSDDEDEKLNEEIEAELDKISISSLEKDETENDSVPDTESDGSDAGLDELPESVLHGINIIQKKTKAAEELIMQNVEDPKVFSCSYGAFSSNYMHFQVGLSTESNDRSKQLMKILSGIDKEEFIRNTHCARPDLIPEPDPQDITDSQKVPDPPDAPDPQSFLALPDDFDMNFGYFDVEERCRKSFEAWQDKQKELEDKETEMLKAQRDSEREQFQEEEEKRHFWIKQFEAEKKKLEDIQQQEQDKMNDEIHREENMWKEKSRQHEEFIRNLHLQMEEERARFNDKQEKEKSHLLEVRNSAAVKIQAKYKAFTTYKKYGPIIREQIETKRRKVQEWKEKEAKIRQKEEERRKRLEEEHRLEEEIKKQMDEERKKREKEYEDKKNILRKEREELRSKEKTQSREDPGQQLIISCSLRRRDYDVRHVGVTDKNMGEIAQELKEANSRKHDVCIVEQSDKRENLDSQLTLKTSSDVKLVSSQAIMAELNVKEKNENLAKQQCLLELDKKEIRYETIIEKPHLENTDIAENMNEQFQLQELKSQTPDEESGEHTTHEKMGEAQMNGCREGMNDANNPEAHKIIRGNQQIAEKEESAKQRNSLSKQNITPGVSPEQNQLLLKLENCESTGGHVILGEKEISLNSKVLEEFPKDNTLCSDTVISTMDAIEKTEIMKQENRLGENVPTEDWGSSNAESSQATTEAHSFQSEIQEIQEDSPENGAARESIEDYSTPESTILSSIEEQRQAWVKSCKPWLEILKECQQKKIIKRRRTVKCPANMMPPLNALDILHCGPWNTLQQVTTITLQGLPGCNLSTLADCPNLQFLSLQRCGLVSLNGLSHCRKLKYIDAQENHIEAINCENMENLSIVLLNKNQLTSIHGLDGCTNIQNLELSYNKITRIGGLESLNYLQHLSVDHNQLISTKGLCDAPTIVYLDCSYNHLTELEGIENCGLLQILNLQGNYLSEPPLLKNHVLLRELHLDDNSISTVEAFPSCWLPLLRDITLSQNSLTKIVPLFHFVSLEKLDVSNNCLSDLTSAMKWLDACYSLRELSLTGNPVLQEVNGRNSLLKTLPALRILNGEMLAPSSEIPTGGGCHPAPGAFLALCQSQIQEFTMLSENYATQKGDMFTLEAVENLCHYFKKLMKLSNECRHVHEDREMSITKRVESEVQHKHLAFSSINNTVENRICQSWANKHNTDSPDIYEKLMNFDSMNAPLSCEDTEGRNQENTVGQKTEDSKPSHIPSERITFMEPVMTNSPLNNHQNIDHCEMTTAATTIQTYWRAYIIRRQSKFSEKIHPPAIEPLPSSFIHNQTTVEKEMRGNIMTIQEQMEKAALRIQAVWKGFILRKKLVTALEAIKSEESDEEYEEINLEDFTFNENSGVVNYDDNSLNIPTRPAQAWLCNEKDNVSSSEHTQLNSRSESGALSWTSESKTSTKSLLKSEKEERISEEWGFKYISTAQQMLKRAEKMKSKKLKKKIDPTVRLALFKNNENKSSKKKQSRRFGYFEAKGSEPRELCMLSEHSTTDHHPQTSSLCKEQRPEDHQSPSRMESLKLHRLKASRWKSDGLGLLMFFSGHRRQAPPVADKAEDIIYKDTSVNEKLERSKAYTSQWLHTQTGIRETNISRNIECDHFLPELDPDVLNGGRVQLVARLVSREDTDLDLFSMTSGSALSVNREKKSQAHKPSAGSSSCSSKGVLTPMKSKTRPSKKERISFRDNPVRLSGGWGSGKKKAKSSS